MLRWPGLRLQPMVLLGLIALAEYVAPWPAVGRAVALVLAALLAARFVVDSGRHLRHLLRWPAVRAAPLVEMALSALAVLLLVSKFDVWVHQLGEPAARAGLEHAYLQYAGAFLVVSALRVVAGDFSARRALHRLDLRPAQTVGLGFAGAILVGAILLSLPVSLVRLQDLSLMDALFTATSAVTVTGLVVTDPGATLTAFGQVVVLGLIQLGGLGTMAASASLVVLAGRALRLARVAALQEAMDLETVGQVQRQLRAMLGLTAAAEVLGALALWLGWRGRDDIQAPLLSAIFHSVSAFCNAGFSTFDTNLARFRDDAWTLAVVAILVVVGGLGFPVLVALGRLPALIGRGRARPVLSLHARLALLTSGLLLAGGTAAVLVLEHGGVLAGRGWPGRLLDALFLSVTARTAGFNTVDSGALSAATLALLMLLMFVGGSPGSTAGGIKTTTAAVALAALWATVRGRPRVEVFRRTLADEQVAKALALAGVAFATVAVGSILLLALQDGPPTALVFEIVSAFGTVGLSTGITAGLNEPGKAVIMLLMFIGRVGPLTLGFALAARAVRRHVVYPTEKVMIG